MSYLSIGITESWNTLKDQAKELTQYSNYGNRHALSKPKFLIKYYDMNKASSELLDCILKYGREHKLNAHTREMIHGDDRFLPNLLHNHDYHWKHREDEANDQGLIKQLHTMTANFPLRCTTSYGKSMLNVYITFDDKKVYSVKALLADPKSGNKLKRVEIPGAKEIVMKCKK